MTDSLFAHLAMTFGRHPENLATEALGYILRTSPGAQAGVRDLLREVGCAVPENLSWVNQLGGGDDARPDLVGLDGSGRQLVLLEAKFWAGLTEKQPVAYLDRLAPGGSLIVVGPAQRQTLLWAELQRRVVEAGRPLGELSAASHGASVALLGEKHLVLLSWRSVLVAAQLGAEAQGEKASVADIAQLQGLCDRQDSEAFIPVTAEELTGHHYRRVVEFSDIVDTVVGLLVEQGVVTIKGLRATSGKGFYQRYLRLNGGVGASLLCDVRKWMKFGATPMWLTVQGPTWKEGKDMEHLLAPLATKQQRRMFMTVDGFPTVPIFVPVGKERHVVEQRAVEQVANVAKLVVGVTAASAVGPNEPPIPDADASA